MTTPTGLDLDEAIIFSAKHVGHWDEQLSDKVRSSEQMKLYLDIPALKQALTRWGLEQRIDELKKVGCCDYWEDGCSLNVCKGEQLKRIEELQANLQDGGEHG